MWVSLWMRTREVSFSWWKILLLYNILKLRFVYGQKHTSIISKNVVSRIRVR